MKGIRFTVIIVVIAAAFHFLPFLNGVEAAVTHGFLSAVGGIRNAAVAVASVPRSMKSAAALTAENEHLRDEIRTFEEKVSELAATAEENDSLRALLELKKRDDLTFITANVIGSDPDVSAHAIVIDRGSESGITRGDAIIVGAGTLVGKAERVVPGRTTVLLTVDQKSSVAAMVQAHPEANGVAEGDRGLVVKLGLIPQNAPVAQGDIVVTTGLEPAVPRGLLIGIVDSVSRTPSDPFASAIIIPSVDVLKLTVVSVVHKKR